MVDVKRMIFVTGVEVQSYSLLSLLHIPSLYSMLNDIVLCTYSSLPVSFLRINFQEVMEFILPTATLLGLKQLPKANCQ